MQESECIKGMIGNYQQTIRFCEEQIQNLHSEISARCDTEWIYKCFQVAMGRIIKNLEARLENPEGHWPQSIDAMEREILEDLASSIGTEPQAQNRASRRRESMKSEPDWMNDEAIGYCNWLLKRRGYWMLKGDETECAVCPVRYCCYTYSGYEDPLDQDAMESLDMEDAWDDYFPDLHEIPTLQLSSPDRGNFDDAAADFAYDAAREQKAKAHNVGSRKWRG